MMDAERTNVPQPTILVVDDHEQSRLVAEGQLTTAGLGVVLAHDGMQAIHCFAEKTPDLVLLDVMMPGLDGFETCRRLRALPGGNEVPIVFLTALNDFGAHQQALLSGADDFLTKPINRTELLMRVNSLLRIRQLNDELRRGHEVIREQRDILLTTQRQKSELTQLIVHDLKNPLAAILSNAQFISTETAGDEREAARDIVDSARAMLRMVMNLLDIGRSEDGVLAPNWSCVEPNQLLEQVRRVMEESARIRDLSIELELAAGVAPIEADADLLRRLLENLVDNAIKYSQRGGAIHVSARDTDDGWLELSVSDTGPGVPEAWRERIFEKYVRLDRDAHSETRTSRGLGLVYCRLAAEAHGGRIWVEPNDPQGTVFRTRLPRRRGP
ncbi:MAG TPA: hybrid sensor histidine kinase/response regulator [Xanthomonadales bacterium]|nr:hybrid sensor histidine kinase/response regulator [Xanthomonadales bacterium]